MTIRNLKPGTEGTLRNEENETFFFRVYQDGGMKVEGFNFLEHYKNIEEAAWDLEQYGCEVIETAN